MIRRAFLALLCVAAMGAAATSLVDPRIFPVPWKPGTGDAAFDTPTLTFANLPAGTTVTIFTLRAQRVWRGTADGNGTLQWNGASDSGKRVASGTYLVLLDGGGWRTTRRIVVIR